MNAAESAARAPSGSASAQASVELAPKFSEALTRPSIELSGSSMPVATALQARPGGAPDASVAASRSAASGSCRAIAIRRSRLARDSRRPSR